MRARGAGRIVGISGAGAVRGMPGISAYSACKGGVERWCEALAQEVSPFGLGVSILLVGAFDTDIITDQGTPDYGDHNGPYSPMYKAMHTNGKALVSKPSPPSLFAKALYETASEKIGRASCRERVCQYV